MLDFILATFLTPAIFWPTMVSDHGGYIVIDIVDQPLEVLPSVE